MFNSERVTIIFFKCGDLQQACVSILHLYHFEIIQLDWVTIYCFKKTPSKSGKIDIKSSPYAGSNKA